MRISVCIPVYNYDVRPLVYALSDEIQSQNLNVEIIIIDDASQEKHDYILTENQKVRTKLFRLTKNIGRARIRNLFLKYSTADFLLFLDCDGMVTVPNFLQAYINYLKNNPDRPVIYGGRYIIDNHQNNAFKLRSQYALERENLPVKLRRKQPYLSFQTNNFIIERRLFEKINFNPTLQKYGYEDLLFSLDLKAAGVPIAHIHNPVLNMDIEDNTTYLAKVTEAVENLAQLYQNYETKEKIKDIRLINAYEKLKSAGIQGLARTIFIYKKTFLYEKLARGNANLIWLDLYKLGLLLEKLSKRKHKI